MEISVVLARVWGLYLLIFVLSFLLNKKLYSHLLDAMGKESIMYVTAFFALLIGVVTVSLNNIWAFDYRGLITVFGWVSIFKGVICLVSPEFTAKAIKRVKVGEWFYAYVIVGIIVGAYLTYVGFVSQ